jgi:hypothetical protein
VSYLFVILDRTQAAPAITLQPQNRDYGLSEPTTSPTPALTVTAIKGGTGTLSYQWYTHATANPVPIDEANKVASAATTATYRPPLSTSAGTAYYCVVVTETLNGETTATASATARVRYRTLVNRIADAAGATATIKLYQDESFAGVSSYNISAANTRITIVSSNASEERTVTLSSNGYMFLTSGATVSLTLGSGVVLQGHGSNVNSLVGVVTSSSFAMEAGSKVIGNKSTFHTGGVYVSSGRFTMSGGTISNNSAGGNGGGIYADIGNATFEMIGGTISGNSAGGNGGGVGVTSTGVFTMSGGVISGNTAANGRGAFIASSAVTMSGSAYFAQDSEVYLSGSTTIALSGALIAYPAAMVAVPSYATTRLVLTGDLTTDNIGRFTVKQAGWSIGSDGKLVAP